jgi:hypothetical protein
MSHAGVVQNSRTFTFSSRMARFLLGDELGHIKSLRYTPDAQEKVSLTVVHDASQRHAAIQGLAISSSKNEPTMVRISVYRSQLNVASAMVHK